MTGGIRGIGAAISRELADHGFDVVAGYHARDATAERFSLETDIDVERFDVADYEAVRVAVDGIETRHGPIDVLVNNAGITSDHFLHRMTPDQWRSVLATNLDSVYNCCHAVLPGMRERGFGRIVNISSVNGLRGQIGQTNYAAAKAGLLGFSKSLARETARKGVTVNVVAPGYINTSMLEDVPEQVLEAILEEIPVGYFGEPEDVAHMVRFLAGDEARYITGATISVNGGQHM